MNPGRFCCPDSFIARTVSFKLLGFVFSFALFCRFCAVRWIRLAISSVFERT